MISLGLQVIDWVETFLVHGPGDIEGEPIRLDDEFAAFIVRAYELNPDGLRRVRRAVLSRPKGRAKSELAAFLSIVEALGPCRFLMLRMRYGLLVYVGGCGRLRRTRIYGRGR